MLASLCLHMKSGRVCIKTRSTPATLPLKGQVTKHTTVKWAINNVKIVWPRWLMVKNGDTRSVIAIKLSIQQHSIVPLFSDVNNNQGGGGGKQLPIHSLKRNPNDVLTTCKAICEVVVSGSASYACADVACSNELGRVTRTLKGRNYGGQRRRIRFCLFV